MKEPYNIFSSYFSHPAGRLSSLASHHSLTSSHQNLLTPNSKLSLGFTCISKSFYIFQDGRPAPSFPLGFTCNKIPGGWPRRSACLCFRLLTLGRTFHSRWARIKNFVFLYKTSHCDSHPKHLVYSYIMVLISTKFFLLTLHFFPTYFYNLIIYFYNLHCDSDPRHPVYCRIVVIISGLWLLTGL